MWKDELQEVTASQAVAKDISVDAATLWGWGSEGGGIQPAEGVYLLSVDNVFLLSILALAAVQSDSAWFTMRWSWADVMGPSAPTVTPDMWLNRL